MSVASSDSGQSCIRFLTGGGFSVQSNPSHGSHKIPHSGGQYDSQGKLTISTSIFPERLLLQVDGVHAGAEASDDDPAELSPAPEQEQEENSGGDGDQD